MIMRDIQGWCCVKIFFFFTLVFDDLHEITRRHFKDLHTMTLHKLEEERLRTYEERSKRNTLAQTKPIHCLYSHYPGYTQYNMYQGC